VALFTAAELRDAIPELTGTAEDTKLDALIARVDAAFARYCGIPAASATASPTLLSTSYILYLTGRGGRDLVLPLRAVTAVASVYDDPTRDFSSSSYLVSSADYALRYDPQRGQYLYLLSTAAHGAWSEGEGYLRVSCTSGYGAGAAPADILEAARIGVRAWWDARKNRGKSSSGGQPSAQYTDPEDRYLLNDEVKQLLGPFRLPGAMFGGVLG